MRFSAYLPQSWRQLSPTAWRYLAANSLYYLGFMVMVFLYNLYLEDAGFSQATIGQITSLVGIGLMVGSIPSGLLVDRLGPRPVLVIATLSMLLAVTLRSLTTAMPLLLAGAFWDGVSLALFTVSGPVMLSTLTNEQNRAVGFSLSGAVLYFNSIVGTLLAGWLVTLFQEQANLNAVESDRWTLLISRLPLLGAAALYATLPNLKSAVHAHGSKQEGIRLPLSLVLVVVATILTMIFADSLFLPYLTIYFRRTFDLETNSIAQLSALTNIVTVFVFLALPRLSKLIGDAAAVSGLRLAAVPFLGALLLSVTLPVAWAATMVAQVTQQIWVMIDSLLVSGVPERLRGRVMGVKESIFGVSVAVAVPIGGWLADQYGYNAGILLSAGLGLLFGVMVLRWFNTRPALEPSPLPIEPADT